MPDDYSRRRIVLGTYATVPLMVNWLVMTLRSEGFHAHSNSAIHLWFSISNGLCFLSVHEGCPNCRQSLHAQELAPSLSDVGSSYRDVEDQPLKSDDYVRLP
jgi:hypothetical protein